MLAKERAYMYICICMTDLFCYTVETIMEKAMAPHSSTLAWKIPWMEEPAGYTPWGCEEWDMTERLHFNFLLSCTGEGNGNPLLENPRDWSLVGCHLWGHTELDTTDVT